ncbi:hypothetical protein [Phyllobacterium myrsinacearum]|uniref:Uncharacterized protein n=1 Tax=Phyllobacterium myrsinacearum TaxID=28101 RepID=A0A839EZD4_9HYPH|nr:hypothetical protein [Phyllobacterium myrsinacearum]MBA8881737.1 hypothetical protein [Phyllobacterium myrsinacearum]
MTNRLIFGNFNGEQVLRISRPGFDVLGNLTDEQLAFDSRWYYTGRVWLKGVANIGAGPYTIDFGRTFQKLPMVEIFYTVSGSPYYRQGSFDQYSFTNYNMTLRFTASNAQNKNVYYFVMES